MNFILLLLFALSCAQVPPTWHSTPNPRKGSILLVKDTKELILYGGTDGTNYYHDLWAYDTHKRTWSALPVTSYLSPGNL
jgi:Kelch motif